ncbi:hypothetical protein, partial [Acinetobacter haemolyticus]|uniref:hypothetical protein n=1 Tax=Acinetobacter haemolyticus TaxID=29430 RepID=UPI00196AFED0
LMPFFFILSLRQVGHLISRVIRISLFYQNSTCFVSAYFLKHHRNFICCWGSLSFLDSSLLHALNKKAVQTPTIPTAYFNRFIKLISN